MSYSGSLGLKPSPPPTSLGQFAAIWNYLGPIQTVLFAFAAAAAGVIKTNGIPTSLPGWCLVVGPALVAVGALHTTAPRHQGNV